MQTIVRAPKGTGRHEIPLSDIQVPDLWHIGWWLKENGKPQAGDAVLECWSLCHDLLANLKGDIEPPTAQEGH